MSKSLLLMVALATLAGCEQTPAELSHHRVNHPTNKVEVFHDDVRAVTCWLYDGVQEGGVSCLPDWMIANPQAVNNPESIPTYPTGEPCLKNKACIGFDKRRRALERAEAGL